LGRPEQNGDFDRILVESIDETITALLSEQVANALYSYLQRVHSISKHEIPNRLGTLSSTLEKTFGPPSSKTISRAIAKKLYTKLDLTFPKHDSSILTLLEYVQEAEIKLRQRGGKG
jgi:hypothetical protein